MMTNQIDEQHAKTLIEVISQSSNWKLHPEKKPVFKNEEEAFRYVENSNEPLCIMVPISESDDHVTVRASSSGEHLVLSNNNFDTPVESKLHHSHLKLISNTVSEMMNQALPEGKQVTSF